MNALGLIVFISTWVMVVEAGTQGQLSPMYGQSLHEGASVVNSALPPMRRQRKRSREGYPMQGFSDHEEVSEVKRAGGSSPAIEALKPGEDSAAIEAEVTDAVHGEHPQAQLNVPKTRASLEGALATQTVDVRTLSHQTRIKQRMKLPIKKYSRDAFISGGKEDKELILPGKMASAPLYILDVIALPRENSLAVLALDKRLFTSVSDATLRATMLNMTQSVEHELANLPMALVVDVEHKFHCRVLRESITEGMSDGGNQVLMCRVDGVDIAEELNRAKQASTDVLKIRIGSEEVHLNARRLSAATRGTYVTRDYFSKGKTNEPLLASAIIPMYGKTPHYLSETMAYLHMSGISHVYIGLFDQETPNETRRLLEPFMQKGFVSVLETDQWPGIHFGSKRNAPPYFTDAPVERWKTLMNDWALYHAKGWDDLLLVHDYDELMVPTIDKTVPRTVDRLLQSLRSSTTAVKALSDICFFNICPLITLGNGTRMNKSRAEDFPFMEGQGESNLNNSMEPEGFNTGLLAMGAAAAAQPAVSTREFCKRGGHSIFYPKSIAVVETTYKLGLHLPGSCSVVHRDPFTGDAVGPHMNVAREQGLHVQHFVNLNADASHRWGNMNGGTPSLFTKFWGQQLQQQQQQNQKH